MKQMTSFGRIVKGRRRALDLTQAELARRVGSARLLLPAHGMVALGAEGKI